MDEILKKLLESDVLSEETKVELSAQFKTLVEAHLAEARAQVEADVTAKLTEEFVAARAELTESVNAKVDAFLTAEFDELKEDINKFRDLEVEYAEKLVEEKEVLAQKLSEELDQLVDKIDAYLDFTISSEFEELKEDIDSVKKLEFGRRIFEAMELEFRQHRKSDLGTTETELAEAKDKLADATRQLAEIESQRVLEARSSKMEDLLSPLQGSAREQMKVILSNVATEKLDEAYKIYLPRILRESVSAKTAEVTQSVIVESPEAKVEKLTLVTGNEDDAQPLNEATTTPSSNQLSRLRKLAGLA